MQKQKRAARLFFFVQIFVYYTPSRIWRYPYIIREPTWQISYIVRFLKTGIPYIIRDSVPYIVPRILYGNNGAEILVYCTEIIARKIWIYVYYTKPHTEKEIKPRILYQIQRRKNWAEKTAYIIRGSERGKFRILYRSRRGSRLAEISVFENAYIIQTQSLRGTAYIIQNIVRKISKKC